uniref:Reverse transcriptase domain-containing protein n=1 Tax=Strongyloides papillosus TaxID=174720 RepID=A0A0N5BDS9_STREA
MGAQPDSIISYCGKYDYIEYIQRVKLLSGDNSSLGIYFARAQPEDIAMEFFDSFDKDVSINDIGEDHIQAFCEKYQVKCIDEKTKELLNFSDVRRKFDETASSYVMRLKRMLKYFNGTDDLLLFKIIGEVPIEVKAKLKDDNLSLKFVMHEWDEFLRLMGMRKILNGKSNEKNFNNEKKGDKNQRVFDNDFTRKVEIKDEVKKLDSDIRHNGNVKGEIDIEEKIKSNTNIMTDNGREKMKMKVPPQVLCFNCGGNHYASKCELRGVQMGSLQMPESFKVAPMLMEAVSIAGIVGPVNIDTGSQVNLLPLGLSKQFSSRFDMKRINVMGKAIDGKNVELELKAELPILALRTNKRYWTAEFYFAKGVSPTISYHTARELDISVDELADEVIKNRESIMNKLNEVHYHSELLANEFVKNEKIFNDILLHPISYVDIPVVEEVQSKICKPYKLKDGADSVLRKQLADEIVNERLVQVFNPRVTSPVRIVLEPKPRMCMDARRINKYLAEVEIELPNLVEIQQKLSQNECFSKADLKWAFKNLGISDGSQEYSTIVTAYGTFQSNRLQFGYKSSSSIFHKWFESCLKEFGVEKYILYIDDLCLLGSKQDQIIEWIKVINCCAHYNIKLNFAKCSFFCNDMEFLGHKFSVGCVSVLDARLNEVKNLQYPSTKDEWLAVLGKLNYMSKFIPNYGKLAKKLYPKKSGIINDSEGKIVWKELMNEIHNVRNFYLPLPNEKLYVEAIMDDNVISAEIYVQRDSKKLISIVERKKIDAENRYTSAEVELVSINNALNKLKIDSTRVVLVVSNNYVAKLLKQTDDVLNEASNRLQSLIIPLQLREYDVIVKSKPIHVKAMVIVPNEPIELSLADKILDWQKSDNMCQMIKEYIKTLNKDVYKKLPKMLVDKMNLIDIDLDGMLFVDRKPIISIELGKELALHDHMKNHNGQKALYEALATKFFCFGLSNVCIEIVRKCHVCNVTRPLQPSKAKVNVWPKCTYARERM